MNGRSIWTWYFSLPAVETHHMQDDTNTRISSVSVVCKKCIMRTSAVTEAEWCKLGLLWAKIHKLRCMLESGSMIQMAASETKYRPSAFIMRSSTPSESYMFREAAGSCMVGQLKSVEDYDSNACTETTRRMILALCDLIRRPAQILSDHVTRTHIYE